MSYSAAVLADNPVAYWRFEEGAAPYVDQVNSFSATVVAGTVTSVTGARGNGAVLFNNSNLGVAHNTAFNLASSFTLEFYHRHVTSIGSWPGIFSKGTTHLTNDTGWLLYHNVSNARLAYKWTSNGEAQSADNLVITDGSWNHYAITYDGTNLRFYRNGALFSTTAATIPARTTTSTFQIGRGDGFSNVALDEVAVYTSALTLTRIAAHFNAVDGGGGGSSVIATETWTGANGAAWPAQWTVSGTATTPVTDIQNNAGRIGSTADGGYADRRAVLNGVSATNAEVVLRFQRNTVGYGGVTLRHIDTNNHYMWETDSTGEYLAKRVNNTVTKLGATRTPTGTATDWHWLRFQVTGTTIRYRVWLDGTTEPSTWTSSVTDTQFSSAGAMGIYHFARSTAASYILVVDDLTVTNLGASAPPSGVATVQVRVNGGTWQTGTYNSSTKEWEINLDVSSWTAGTHLIEARATDVAGNVSTIESRTVWHSPDGMYGAAATDGQHLIPVTVRGAT